MPGELQRLVTPEICKMSTTTSFNSIIWPIQVKQFLENDNEVSQTCLPCLQMENFCCRKSAQLLVTSGVASYQANVLPPPILTPTPPQKNQRLVASKIKEALHCHLAININSPSQSNIFQKSLSCRIVHRELH